MYVCMYVRRYVCMYVRTYVRMYVYTYSCICMCILYMQLKDVYVCVHVITWMYMYLYVYVYMYLYIHISSRPRQALFETRSYGSVLLSIIIEVYISFRGNKWIAINTNTSNEINIQ